MKVEYQYSEQVLRELKYSTDDIKNIIATIEKGAFSYMPKYVYDNNNSKWENSAAAGIDIPTMWFSDSDKYEKTIMLLAQDPLRKDEYWDFCENKSVDKSNNVIIGTPYALHIDANHSSEEALIKKRLKLNVKIYRDLIRELISVAHCRVYCTDIFKYYPSDKQIGDFDIKILKKEIELTHPNLFVCMGGPAQNAINIIKSEIDGISDDAIICTPHPRARPQSWDKWRGEITDDYTDKAKISDIVNRVETKL